MIVVKKKKSLGILDVGKARQRISQSSLKFVHESSESKKRDKFIPLWEVEEEIIFRYIERTGFESSSNGRVSIWT